MRDDLSKSEQDIHAFRVKLFTLDHCWPEERAQEWADRLVGRDRSGDDRRICPECAHLLSQWRCAKRGHVIAEVPQRCPMFVWATIENREWQAWEAQ